MVRFIFSRIGRRAGEYFKTRPVPKIATILGFFVVFAMVMIGLYELIRHGLEFIASNVYFGNAVSLYIYEMILLLVVALSIATALIEGTFSLFRNASNLWILSSPGYKRIPHFVLSGTILGGAFLPLLILAIPTLAAMEHVYHIGVLGFLFGLVSILLVVAATIIVTFIILFVVAKILSAMNVLRMSSLLAVMLLIVVVAGALAWRVVGAESNAILFPNYSLTANAAPVPQELSSIIEHYKYFPSHPAALVLYDSEQGNVANMLGETAVLALIVMGTYVVYRLVSEWYLSLWQSLQAEPRAEVARSGKVGPEKFPRYFKGPIGALLEKEALVITRTGRDFMWLLFMVFLWLIQIGADVLIKKSSASEGVAAVPFMLQAFEVGVIAYFLGAFALRFAFPTFSIERGTAWIVNATPLSLERIYFGKLLFFCGFFSVLSILVAVLHSVVLSLSVVSAIYLCILAVVLSLTITTFAIMLGILFPNFETTDPQELSTSLPGIGFVFFIILYGALGAYTFFAFLSTQNLVPMLGFAVLSGLLILLSISQSLNKLKRFEFG